MNSRIIKAVAKEQKVSQELLEKINSSMWLVLKLTAESGSLQPVMYPTFGKFAVKARNRIVYGGEDWNPQDIIRQNKEKTDYRRLEKLAVNKNGTTSGSGEDAAGKVEDLSTVSI